MSSKRLARLAALCGLAAAAVVAPLATPAAAYTATGTIAKPAPGGAGVTDTEFAATCPAAPATQGVDGYVFTLPAPAAAGDLATLKGTSATPFTLATYVYKNDCTYSRFETSLNPLTLQAGDRYLSVYAPIGANVTVTLTAPPAGGTGPNDPLFYQNGEGDLLLSGQWNMRKVGAVDAWAEATGAGIKVAVLDTGLDLSHPDFDCTNKVQVIANADPDPDGNTQPEDDDGHGTHTAGIVGACANNNEGVVGIAPDSTILPIQVLSATGGGAPILAQAIEDATDAGAHVINMSLSFSLGGVPLTGSALGFFGGFPEIDAAIDYAVSKGVVVVASSGNDSMPLCSYPAIAYNVVCVASSTPWDTNAWYSSFPVKDDDSDLVGPALIAPGGSGVLFCDLSATEILSTYDRSADAAEGDCDGIPGYASIQGTSMASPLVAGAAALVYEDLGGTRSTVNADKVIEALLNTAVDLYTPGYDPLSGEGRLDARAAVNYWP